MKPWFSLALVCWAWVCLLLSLSQQAGLNHPLQVADSGQRLDRCREVASGSPTAAVLRSMEFDPVRAGPLASLILDGRYRSTGPGDPWTTGADRNLASCRSKPAAQSNIEPTCSTKFLVQPTEFEEIGVLQQPLATFRRKIGLQNSRLTRILI